MKVGVIVLHATCNVGKHRRECVLVDLRCEVRQVDCALVQNYKRVREQFEFLFVDHPVFLFPLPRSLP